jgi:hypothetical protein
MEKEEKQVRLRSRLYPRYDLEDSINFIRSLQTLGGSNVSQAALAAKVGKSVNNSGFSGRISSSKQFSLLTIDSGKLSISSLGKRILLPKGDADKNSAIATALAAPDLYKELIENFNGKIIPDTTTLGNLLAHDYRMEVAAKDGAARNFIRSANFAGVLQNGILVVGENIATSEGETENGIEADETAPFSAPLQGTPLQKNIQNATFQDNGEGWSILIKSQKPLNSKTKAKLIEVAEFLDEINKS